MERKQSKPSTLVNTAQRLRRAVIVRKNSEEFNENPTPLQKRKPSARERERHLIFYVNATVKYKPAANTIVEEPEVQFVLTTTTEMEGARVL